MPRRARSRARRGGNAASRQIQNEDNSAASSNRGGQRGSSSSRRNNVANNSRGRQRRAQTSRQGTESSVASTEQPRRRRPVTISLDVTFSSEDEDNLPLTPSPPPSNDFDDINYALTPSPPSSPQRNKTNELDSELKTVFENGIGNVEGDNSDADSDSPVCSSPLPKKFKPEIPVYDGNSSSDDDDPFAVDYLATKKKAMEHASKDIAIIEKERQKERLKEQLANEIKDKEEINSKDTTVEPEPVLEVIDESSNDTDKEKENKKDSDCFFEQLGISPFDIKSPDKKKKINVNRKTKKALDQLKELRYSNLQQKFNDVEDDIDDDCLIVSDEEDTNAEQTIRIRWGGETIKYTLRRLQKFSFIHQKLAEKHNVSVSKVILVCRDTIINPDSCPADFDLTAADIFDGGIQKDSKPSSSTNATERDPDSIELKVQNANTKGSVKLYISKYDKMAVLMHKYAEEMKKTVKDFRFVFDGERLQSDDTPESLDLDGGECIDAYAI